MYVCMYVYIYLSRWRRRGFRCLYQAIIRFVLTCSAIETSEKYFITLLRNTKPVQSLRRTFSRRNNRKKNRSDNNMAAPETSVHPVRNRLCYHFSLYQTNKSCSESVSRRMMLLISFNKSCLRVTAPNVTEAERPFYERSQR